MSIKDSIKKIKENIPNNITIVAATKSRSVEEIKQVIDAGITIIGENYIQEAEKKYQDLKDKVKIHFIGHLQTNKVKKAVELFDLIVIDSEKLALEIEKRATKQLSILIEVNIAKEPNKSGVFPEDCIKLLKNICKLKNIKVIGLFTMGPNVDSEKLRTYFKQMKILFEKIKLLEIKNIEMKTLSMGMSDSYKVAIEEGATEVRLGTVIFGQRK